MVDVHALPVPGWDRVGQRAAVSAVAAARYGELTRLCPHCGSTAHGRPRIAGRPDLHASVSYADGLALLVVGTVPLGADVEAEGPAPAGFADRAAWTAREAALKLTGDGLRRDPWAAPPHGIEVAGLTGLPPGYTGALATWAPARGYSGNAGSARS